MHPESDDDNLVDEWRAGDLWAADRPLRERLLATADGGGSREALAAVADYGAQIGSPQAQDWALQANTRAPELQTLDARGRRIDRVDFHPHWHRLLASIRASGAIGAPFEASAAPGRWTRAAATFYLHGQVEAGSLCPATMTQAAIAVLRRHAPTLAAALHEGLHSREHDAQDAPIGPGRPLWIGMGMTEKQGGSDLRRCSSQARPLPGTLHGLPRVQVDGHKWFFSAPMSDAHLVLAQTEAGPACVFLPRWRFDGSALNGVRIQRLKDKLGNRSNSSSEVEFHASEGLLIGAPGRGIAVLAEMAGITRLQCVVGSTAMMRAGLVQACHFARRRQAFGRRLAEQPLMQQLLADLALEVEAALALMLRIAQAFDADGDADPVERAWQRVLTPAAKLWVCKRAIGHAGECMEVLGGNGYVETGSLARLYREAPVNSIWEGSGNVMALDVLRAAQREAPALQAWGEAQARRLPTPERQRLQQLLAALARPDTEASARQWAIELALLAQAALLDDGPLAGDFLSTRLREPAGLFGARPLPAQALLLDRALP